VPEITLDYASGVSEVANDYFMVPNVDTDEQEMRRASVVRHAE
jgi:hypothetical protein